MVSEAYALALQVKDDENVIIGFVNYHLPPGKHLIEGEFKGDENFYIEYFAKDFYIN